MAAPLPTGFVLDKQTAPLPPGFVVDNQDASDPATPYNARTTAPRWDILGDIGRAARGSYSALKSDLASAFPNPVKPEFNPLDSIKRMGSAAKVPLDALGIVGSPVTGAIHGLGGSALSYVVPTPDKDITLGGQTFYSDPKRAADQILDKTLLLLAPEDPAAIAAGAPARAAASAERANVKLTNRAIDKVRARLDADQIPPQDIVSAQQAANAAGDKLTLMDLGGKNVRGLAGAVYRAPGPAGQAIDSALEARDAASANALADDVQTSVARGSTYNASQDLLNSRSAAARPAYAAAEDIGPIHSDRLQMFLDTPEVQQGLRRGFKLERLNAIAENRPIVDSDYAVIGYKDGNFDMPEFGKVPTMKSMIVANEGLGAQIADMINPVTGRPTKDGLALKKFRDAFQAELDSLSGGKYAAARDVWSGPAQSMEALQDGRLHFSRKESNDQIKAEFDQLSPGDKEFYRMGAAEAKIDAVENAPDASDKSKRVINTERDRKRFRMLFDSDAQAQQFIDTVKRKRTQFETRQAIKGGSPSAGRIADDINENVPLALDAAATLGHVGSGNWLGAIGNAYRLKRDLGLRNNPALNSEIARLMLNPDLGAAGLNPLPLSKLQRPLLLPLTLEGMASSQASKK